MTGGIFIDASKNENKKYSWNDKELQTFKDVIIREKINCRTDDKFLLSFLRARKFERERAIKLLKNYYSSREKNQDIFAEFNPLAVKKYLDMKVVGYLEQTDQDGRVLAIGKTPRWDPSKIHLKEILKCTLMLQDMVLTEHIFQVNGLVMILDAETLSWRHTFQLTPSTIHSVISLLFGSTPVSYKEIHIINIGRFVHAFLAAFMPFLPYKIKKRLYLHSSGMESLHKFIDPKYLPSDFGGELPAFDPTQCNERLLEHQQFFMDNEKYWKKQK